jgi:imidazole glycerol-phosphate synthase subunit HisH
MSTPSTDGPRLVKPRVAVLDYGAANMVSITRALASVGAEVRVAADPAALAGVDAIVVPGVGAAQFAMDRLREDGLLAPLLRWVVAGRPCLGICLGFQILFESSEEADARTTGLLAGRTIALRDAPTLPHIGWNSAELTEAGRARPLFAGVPDGSYFYFVHSFAPEPSDEAIVLSMTTHGQPFVSAVARGSCWGVQFHPEKSAEAGLRVLSNFLGLAGATTAAGANTGTDDRRVPDQAPPAASEETS